VSKMDRVDLATVRQSCCIAAIQRKISIAAEGDELNCPDCGTLVFKSGQWTR
jgi:predicted RNA-binding Zn-ribbon protein involved in translation (DUF1610 family)